MFDFIKNLIKKAPAPAASPLPEHIEPQIIEPIVSVPPKPIEVPVATNPSKESIDFLSVSKIQKILKFSKEYSTWYDLFQKYFPLYDINTIVRASAFLANVAHESGEFKIFEENLHYSRESLLRVFPKYFNEKNVDRYANNPEAIASRVYANRMGNGDEASQDGWKFKGRCLIQITGKNNYLEISKELNKTLPETISYFTTKEGCLVGSLIWWSKNNINKIADKGSIVQVRRAVNGGVIGLSDVIAKYNTYINILKG